MVVVAAATAATAAQQWSPGQLRTGVWRFAAGYRAGGAVSRVITVRVLDDV